MCRAVVMTVSGDRPQYLIPTLQSWRDVRRLDEWLVAFCVEPGTHAEECVDLIQAWRACSDVPRSFLLRNDKRLGVLHNPYVALRWAFERASFAVLAEEDVLVSADACEYFTALADAHYEDEAALGICAFAHHSSRDVAAYELRQDFNPLCWGTWLDRWTQVIEPQWFSAARRGPSPGVQEGWDWGMARIVAETGRGFLAPRCSRSQHIGVRGVHMLSADFPASQSPSFEADRPAAVYRLSERIGGG